MTLVTYPLAACAWCRSIGCNRMHEGLHYCGAACVARAVQPIPILETVMPAPKGPRAPFVVGEIETIEAVPVVPRTPGEHIAAALSKLEAGQTVAFGGVGIATVRRVAKAWLAAFDARESSQTLPDLRVGLDADGERVRVWRR